MFWEFKEGCCDPWRCVWALYWALVDLKCSTLSGVILQVSTKHHPLLDANAPHTLRCLCRLSLKLKSLLKGTMTLRKQHLLCMNQSETLADTGKNIRHGSCFLSYFKSYKIGQMRYIEKKTTTEFIYIKILFKWQLHWGRAGILSTLVVTHVIINENVDAM